MKFVDIILPLPLDGVFTYSIPDHFLDEVRFGVRLVVPFGKSKTYVGIAVRIHEEEPNFKYKEVKAVLDQQPILHEAQYTFWKWIAEYYMSSIGDVYKAALPAALKEEEGYRPRTELYVSLAPNFRQERALELVKSMLGRAEKQRKVLDCYLNMSHWSSLIGGTPSVPITEITREELMNESHCTSSVIKALIDRKVMMTYKKEVGRLNVGGQPHPEAVNPLNDAQQTAYNQVLFNFMKKDVVLLHGVTSSGKTEVYIHLIEQALKEHKQVLYLLPEIALTVQITTRLQRVFGNRMAIYHSKYSDAERAELWLKQLSASPYDIILGARSAVFLPFQRLGLVIVDEEHETSYKQQDPAPRYHARSAAIVLSRLAGAKTLLGTATPSIESYYNAQTGKYGLVEMKHRYRDIQLPEIQVVDIQDLQRRKLMNGPFSPLLLRSVREALQAGQQVILFQNRRGFAPMIECKVCGWVPRCVNCDVSLTMHRSTNQLTCHYCGYTYPIPQVCPNCGSTDLRGRGYGTEKIEDQIRDIFPDVRIARMDLDTTRTRNAYERIIEDFSSGKTNMLIGTQMISKGLDFDKVSVVGILNADTMLNYPDFRAYEHAFMMMAQVSGRAGRKGKRGTVILQTRSPQLPIIGQVVNHDYLSFYHGLVEERQTFHYPPFYHLIYVYLKHRHDDVVEMASKEMANRLRQWFGNRVLGPDKPAVAKVMTMNIRKVMLKLETGIQLKLAKQYLCKAQTDMLKDSRYGALVVYYDVDPE